MGNTIALAKSYVPNLDEIYKLSSLSAVLTSDQGLARAGAKANEIIIPKISMDGLGDYSRSNGYAQGDVTLEWETVPFNYDRGRKFVVDVEDDEETINTAFGRLGAEFMRTKVVPEVDAFTFAQLSAKAGTTVSATLSSGTDVTAAITAANSTMDDAEVPMEGRILFVSTKTYYAIKNKLTRFIMNDEENIQRNIEMLDSMRVIPVPSGRFNTAITLNDGVTSGQTAGGFAVGGYPINFMLVHPSAIIKVMKHRVPRIFSPDVVQEADAWKFNIRLYGDCFVKDNKVGGIYLHRGATAN